MDDDQLDDVAVPNDTCTMCGERADEGRLELPTLPGDGTVDVEPDDAS